MKKLPPIVKRPLTAQTGPFRAIAYNLLIITPFVILGSALTWTNQAEGALHATVVMPFIWLLSLFIVLPWIVVIAGINRWRKKKTSNLILMIIPAIYIAAAFTPSIINLPLTAESSFESFSNVRFPENATDVKFHAEGALFHDRLECYMFTTTPKEIVRLINDLHLDNRGSMSPEFVKTKMSLLGDKLNQSASIEQWEDPLFYSMFYDSDSSFCNLIIDKTYTKVYIELGRI